MVKILEKNAIMINFDYIRTYSTIKKRISQIDTNNIQQLNQLQRKHYLHESTNSNSQQMKAPRGNMLQAIQELKIKSITEQINRQQYQSSNIKQGFRKIIELERRTKNIQSSLKDNKIHPKSNEEKFYEICLVLILISFIFSLSYTIIHELKN